MRALYMLINILMGDHKQDIRTHAVGRQCRNTCQTEDGKVSETKYGVHLSGASTTQPLHAYTIPRRVPQSHKHDTFLSTVIKYVHLGLRA